MSRANALPAATRARRIRCAIYCRKSTTEGLEQEFNSLDAQRQSAEAYITSMKHEGWVCLPEHYDDGGFTGGNMDRPALKRLLSDIEAGKIDTVCCYKVDRLSRSLLDFARIMEIFERKGIGFVSVTQSFNSTQSMGRLTLNILLSFAQFERELVSERTRDKIAAARRKGMWAGGRPILGYDLSKSKLTVNPEEAAQVRDIFALYLRHESLIKTVRELNARGWTTKRWTTRAGRIIGGRPWDKHALLALLSNVLYTGKVRHRTDLFDGEHEVLVDAGVWDKVQAVLRENGRTGGMHVRNVSGALLKGLLVCGTCGNTVMGHSFSTKGNNRRYRYYVCQTAQKRGWNACSTKSVPAEEIERFVVDRVKAAGQDPALIDAALEQARAQEQERLAELEEQRRPLERELKRLRGQIGKAAALAGSDGAAAARLADLHNGVLDVEARLESLRGEHAAVNGRMVTRDEVARALREFDPLWGTLTPREQARVVRLLVERVEFDGERSAVAITFRPEGIKTLAGEGARALEACA